MFEKASRQKLRFESPVGLLSTEDLWDLPLTSKTGRANLDDIARALHVKIKDGADVSFVTPAEPADEALDLRFNVVKHIIDVRVAERDKKAEAAARAEQKRKLLDLIGQKQDEELSAKSIEELRAELEKLDG